ncbi:MAG: alpha/beta hydrolase [Oceanospirillaceae bacterium]|nr:alpha/beta hydrolase [Oceanospirillaceae bacterium]
MMKLHRQSYSITQATQHPTRGITNQGEKRLAYWSAGDPQSDSVVVCVHGLLRHSRDFDEIAQALASSHYVVCPDLPGRGLSDPLDAASDYHPERYLQALAPLLAKFQQRSIHWVGTSLGGLLGMALAAQPKSVIRTLVLNDIGPELPQVALQRIADYIDAPQFDNLAQVEEFLRQTYLSYEGLTDQQWQRLARYGSKPSGEGGLVLHYDPLIADNTKASRAQTIELWDLWQAIEQPCLLVQGLASDLLTPDIVARMQQQRPDLKLLQREGIGHAPSLMLPQEVEAVVQFIREQS